MKKVYRRGTVHPTPPAVSDQLLSILPAAILTLTAALSIQEREVLAYLISCSTANFSNTHHKKIPSAAAAESSMGAAADHIPYFSCYCFQCYMSYWVKWDSSPNRQLIHEIIDAFEDSLLSERKKEKNKKERRKGKSIKRNVIALESEDPKKSEPSLTNQDTNFPDLNLIAKNDSTSGSEEEKNGEEEEAEKGSIRRFMSFLGDRIWGAWG